MALFGDERRMVDHTFSQCGNLSARNAYATRTHLGPGSYFTAHNENIRAGWVKRSYSTRQPMGPPQRRKERYHHYTAGVLLKSGHAHGSHDNNRMSTPGPGSYDISYKSHPQNVRISGPFCKKTSQKLSRAGGMGSGSARMLLPSARVKNGLLYPGRTDNNIHIGPGHYAPPSNVTTMLRKSYNVRVNDGNNVHMRMNHNLSVMHFAHDRSPSPSPRSSNTRRQRPRTAPAQGRGHSQGSPDSDVTDSSDFKAYMNARLAGTPYESSVNWGKTLGKRKQMARVLKGGRSRFSDQEERQLTGTCTYSHQKA